MHTGEGYHIGSSPGFWRSSFGTLDLVRPFSGCMEIAGYALSRFPSPFRAGGKEKIMAEREKNIQKYFPVRRNPDNPFNVTLIPVSEEEYRRLMPPIWKHQKQRQALRMCSCTQYGMWKCDADCELCEYATSGHVTSLDEEYEVADKNQFKADCDPESIVSNTMLAHQILIRLNELCPEALEVGDLIQSGLSQREATEKLGINRTLYRYHLSKALRQIEIELKIKDIKKFF